MIKVLEAIVVALACFTVLVNSANADSWAVWTKNSIRPGQVTVAPVGSLHGAWQVDSIWLSDSRGAWKEACWLVRNGDIAGRRYSSADMSAGRVFCDANCNCKMQ